MSLNFKHILKKILPLKIKMFLSPLADLAFFYPSYIFGKGKANAPTNIYLEVTYLCNCRCQMCPIYGKQTDGGKKMMEELKSIKELSLGEYRELFKNLSENGVKGVTFTGGDPFMRKDILDLVESARSLKLEVDFITNGSLITKQIAKSLVDLQVQDMCFSLDGLEHVHNEIRGANVYNSLMDAVSYINYEKKKRYQKNPYLSFGCTASLLNENSFAELVKVAHENKVNLDIAPVFFSSETKIMATQKNFSNKKFIKLENQVLLDSITKVNVDTFCNETRRALSLAQKMNQPINIHLKSKKDIINWFCRNNFSFINKCFFPWYSASINPYGVVYPCSISIPMGDLRSNSFINIWNGKEFTEFRQILKHKNIFPFCSRCCQAMPNHKLWNIVPKFGS